MGPFEKKVDGMLESVFDRNRDGKFDLSEEAMMRDYMEREDKFDLEEYDDWEEE